MIGDSVTTIGKSAFYNCESLISVTIGNNVKTIDDGSFYGKVDTVDDDFPF